MIPSTTLSIVSVLCTFVFYGCLTAVTAIALWELYLNDHASTETNGKLNNEDKAKEMSLKNWFHITHRLIKALEDIIGPIQNTYSLVTAFAYLSKTRKDFEAELWMKKYLHNTNSFCMLVQKKYGVQSTPVVVTFVFVVLIFHDRNRFLLESVWETRGFISNSNRTIEMDFRTTYASDYVSYDINKNLNETYRDIWENLDIIYKGGFETETYIFKIPPGANPHFALNEAHHTRHWKEVKNQANFKNFKKLDKLVFENHQERFPSSELRNKQVNSNDVDEYVRNEIPENDKKLLNILKIGSDEEMEFLKTVEECKKIRRNTKNETTHKQSEFRGKVVVKSEKRRMRRSRGRYPLAYNRELKRRVETEIINNSESKTNFNIISGNIYHINVLNNNTIYNNREVPMEETNFIHPSINLTSTSQNRFVLISPPPKERKIIPSNLRRTSLQDQEHQSDSNDEEGCDVSFQAAEAERCRIFEIQEDENKEKEIPTLEELEERLEFLLDDGTRVKQWLIDLEERFKYLFLK